MLGLAYIRTSAIAKATVVLERAMLGHAIKLPIVEKLAYCYYINKDFMKSTHLLMHMGSKGKRQLIDLELQNQIYQSAMFRRRSRNQKVS